MAKKRAKKDSKSSLKKKKKAQKLEKIKDPDRAEGVDQLDSENLIESAQNGIVSHYWFCNHPSFNTELIFYPESYVIKDGLSLVEVFDADGNFISSARIGFKNNGIGKLDLEPLLSSCKIESGLKHGQLKVRSPIGTRHQCRLTMSNGSFLVFAEQEVKKRKELFFPIVFEGERSSYLTFFNKSSENSVIRVRVFCGSRTPKEEVLVPANGSRIFQLEQLFPEYSYLEEKRLNAYVRVGLREGGAAGCVFFENFNTQAEQEVFRAVS